MSPPGEKTTELILSEGQRTRLEAAEALRRSEREAELIREANRERDMRRLLWLAVGLGVAGLGTAAAFWDDLVRTEVRLEQLEKRAPSADPERPPGWLDRLFD